MKVILFDEAETWQHLLPLTYTRPVADLRVGILTLAEKWERRLHADSMGYDTREYLQKKFPKGTGNIWINAAAVASDMLAKAVSDLSEGEGLVHNGRLIAAHSSDPAFNPSDPKLSSASEYEDFLFIDRTWKIFRHVADEIKSDFALITNNRESAPLDDPHTIVYGRENLFLEPGARVQAAIIDATNGPVYLGKNSFVSAGSIIRGSFALGEESVVNMGAKLRGDTSVGPGCKVGGEISNSVFQANSNKSHDGYLGNSVIGEWCNLGADTNCSNLKNNYAPVKTWSYVSKGFADTGLTFCGLTMGDHSKCGINTMFNTGTVVGVAANIFGSGFPRTFIPSFSWGGASGMITHQMGKATETARLMMERRKIPFSNEDLEIMEEVFRSSAEFRIWEGRK
ncbi:GlmU family protein [Fulvivirga sedimenti]|uniref:GlmU family protein n=1 Tax=Fulvivirga sedimenti TaxID=2879465 RepID=A0A9X1KZ99_9BACT|nr:GlmU family protein [Fulvivirga sedimenti]MCA6078020.1 GlmU family protein [Fulvivirga sedimenti]